MAKKELKEVLDVWEEGAVACEATLKGSKYKKTTACKFVFEDDAGKALGEAEASVSSGAASGEWKAPKLADDQVKVKASYHIVVDEEPVKGFVQQLNIWAKTMTVKATNEKDGKAAAGAMMKISQVDGQGNESTLLRKTDDKGEYKHTLGFPTDVALTWHTPWRLKSWTAGDGNTGRTREAKVERIPYKAVIYWPKPETKDTEHQQFVNLADKAGTPEGSKISIVIQAEGDWARSPGATLGAIGDEVFIQAIASDKNSKRNDPKPGLLIDNAEVVAESDGRTFKGKVKLKQVPFSRCPTGVAQLQLGRAGADTWEVKVGVTDACEDASVKIKTMRQLYYQITRPSTMTAPDMKRITDGLAEVGIKYERYVDLPLQEAEKGTPKGSWFDGPMLGLTGRCLNVGDHNKTFFHGKFKDDKTPLGVHVVFCHKQFDGGPSGTPHVFDIAGVKATKTTKVTFKGAQAYGFRFHIGAQTGNYSNNVFPKALQNGDDSLKSSAWRSLATTGAHKGKSGTIPADCVDIDWVNDKNFINIKVPDDAKAIIDADQEVELDFAFYMCRGEYLGEADGTSKWLQLIAVTAADTTNDVMAHELGHTLNQAVRNAPPGLDLADHGWTYSARGHQGTHCAFGAPKATYDDVGKNLTGIAACKCLLYGENSGSGSLSSGKFCEKCAPFVKAEHFETIH